MISAVKWRQKPIRPTPAASSSSLGDDKGDNGTVFKWSVIHPTRVLGGSDLVGFNGSIGFVIEKCRIARKLPRNGLAHRNHIF
ncbi:hypothetical protein N9B60_06240 [Mariniblastus sp.]|nr:hypothetical protein [Mariniblastus sp.]MDA7924982.1 hypothetical protein [Mariniblastus sp.]MDA7926157.1 hypothetical protein [Mariniblastus sp.]